MATSLGYVASMSPPARAVIRSRWNGWPSATISASSRVPCVAQDFTEKGMLAVPPVGLPEHTIVPAGQSVVPGLLIWMGASREEVSGLGMLLLTGLVF